VVTGAISLGVLLVVVIGALSASLDEYAKGAARTAADEAAQAGAAAGGSLTVCQQQATVVLDGLLKGRMGSDVSIDCYLRGAEMVATGTGVVPSLLPAIAHLSFRVQGVALVPQRPQQ
jgi:hypothetical protein